MAQNRVERVTEELVLPVLERENFELVDVEFKKEGPHRYLRVYIDKPGGISLNDCQRVSEALSDLLDEADPIPDNYFLEVSSPGLDRPLKKEADFRRAQGKLVEVKLYEPLEGKKLVEGELIGLIDEVIHLKVNQETVTIPREKTALTRLVIKF